MSIFSKKKCFFDKLKELYVSFDDKIINIDNNTWTYYFFVVFHIFTSVFFIFLQIKNGFYFNSLLFISICYLLLSLYLIRKVLFLDFKKADYSFDYEKYDLKSELYLIPIITWFFWYFLIYVFWYFSSDTFSYLLIIISFYVSFSILFFLIIKILLNSLNKNILLFFLSNIIILLLILYWLINNIYTITNVSDYIKYDYLYIILLILSLCSFVFDKKIIKDLYLIILAWLIVLLVASYFPSNKFWWLKNIEWALVLHDIRLLDNLYNDINESEQVRWKWEYSIWRTNLDYFCYSDYRWYYFHKVKLFFMDEKYLYISIYDLNTSNNIIKIPNDYRFIESKSKNDFKCKWSIKDDYYGDNRFSKNYSLSYVYWNILNLKNLSILRNMDFNSFPKWNYYLKNWKLNYIKLINSIQTKIFFDRFIDNINEKFSKNNLYDSIYEVFKNEDYNLDSILKYYSFIEAEENQNLMLEKLYELSILTNSNDLIIDGIDKNLWEALELITLLTNNKDDIIFTSTENMEYEPDLWTIIDELYYELFHPTYLRTKIFDFTYEWYSKNDIINYFNVIRKKMPYWFEYDTLDYLSWNKEIEIYE